MPCTTILVGRRASYDGSTMIARNDDSGAGHFMPKKFTILHPEGCIREQAGKAFLRGSMGYKDTG